MYFVDRHPIDMHNRAILHAGHPLPVESPDILLNGHRYRLYDPFLPERRLAATGRIRFELQLGNIQSGGIAGLSHHRETMTLPGKTISPHCGKNTACQQTSKQNTRNRVCAGVPGGPCRAGRADSPDSLLAVGLAHADLDQTVENELLLPSSRPSRIRP